LRMDDTFAERFLAPKANYGDGRNGVDVRRLLVADKSLYDMSIDLSQSDPRLMYRPEEPEGRRAIARALIIDASVQITSSLLMAYEVDALPVADDDT
jgi:hypothetical protein